MRRQIAVAAIDQAVVTGVTEHGDDFALVVEEAPAEAEADGDEPGRTQREHRESVTV